MKIYYSAIKIARKYIRKKISARTWKSFYVLPPKYFNINYKNGFKNFIAKAIQDKETENNKNLERNRLETNKKINIYLKEYFSCPTRTNYDFIISKIKETIPSRLNQFISCVEHKQLIIDDEW